MGRGRGYGPGSSEGAGGARRSKPQDQASSARNLGAKSAGPPHPTRHTKPLTAAGQASNGLVSHGVRAGSRRAAACIVVPRLPVDVSAQPLAGFSAWRTSAPASRRWSRTVPLRCSPLLRIHARGPPARAHLRWCARAAPADFGTV